MPASSVDIDADLDKDQLTAGGHFRIYYTDDCTNHSDKCVSAAEVNQLDAQLEDLYNIYTSASGDFRFNDPTRGTVLPVQVLPIDAGGMANCSSSGCDISLAPEIFGLNLNLEALPLHEMLHQVQWTYGDWSDLVLEGTARMMQDKVYVDLDNSNGAGEMISYFIRSNRFLAILTDKPLIDQSYSACLFWTYFTEQYGSVTAEPQRGVDAIREVFVHNGDGSDDRQRINAALGALSAGETFTDAFAGFIVANYAKDLTGPNVPQEYRYIDDDQPPGAYRSPRLALDRTMPVGDSVTATDEIRDWSAKYYVARPSADSPIISLEFQQTSASSVSLIYNLLVIKNHDLVLEESEFDIRSIDYVKSFPNDDYDEVVVIVGAAELPAAYRYTFSTGGGLPTMNILWPRSADPARVDTDDLNAFQVHLEVLGPGGAMSGLDPEDFNVTVGGTDFDVITGTYVMGQYWIAVQPKTMTPGTTYDLEVEMADGSISDVEFDAVRFEDVLNSDSMIVIDRSGSMLEPNWTGPTYETPNPTDKIYGAIDAATLYLNSFRTGDMIGLVWFSNDAFISKSLSSFNDANRLDITNAINSLDQNQNGAWLATSIGDGLEEAQDQLDSSGNASHTWWIIVLSDGKENEDNLIEDVVCDNCKIDFNISSPDYTNTKIHAVALGSDADREKLELLASQSNGGRFEYVIEPQSGDLPNDLADVYRIFAETALLEQRITAIRGSYSYEIPSTNHTINMEKGATEATFVVNYNWKGMPLGGAPLVTLSDPSGTVVSPTFEDDTHQLFRVPFPSSGTWNVNIMPGGPVEFLNQGTYLVEASVKSKATMEVFLGLPPEERIVGSSLPILAFLTDTDPITGATITLEIMTPEEETALVVLPSEYVGLKLYDDGAHGDGKPNDGVYGNDFTKTYRAGIYDVKVQAKGYSPLVGDFQRETKLAFNMRSDDDGDGDGLPDGWEEEHGLDPADGSGDWGTNGDPDGDGLVNGDELEAGTDPMDADTDNGGEMDGSEVSGGRDPNDPDDDAVKPPTSLRAIPGVGSVFLNIGFLTEHDYLVLYRSEDPSGPWDATVIDPPAFNYTDSGLQNGTEYFYKATGVANRAQPSESLPTRIVSAIPKADPIPPSGYVIINDGETSTKSNRVTLKIWADPDTVEMLISNYPDLSESAWEPFGREKIWSLIPGEGLRTVYVIFRDGAGNTGPRSPYDPSVELEPAMASINLVRNVLAEVKAACGQDC